MNSERKSKSSRAAQQGAAKSRSGCSCLGGLGTSVAAGVEAWAAGAKADRAASAGAASRGAAAEAAGAASVRSRSSLKPSSKRASSSPASLSRSSRPSCAARWGRERCRRAAPGAAWRLRSAATSVQASTAPWDAGCVLAWLLSAGASAGASRGSQSHAAEAEAASSSPLWVPSQAATACFGMPRVGPQCLSPLVKPQVQPLPRLLTESLAALPSARCTSKGGGPGWEASPTRTARKP